MRLFGKEWFIFHQSKLLKFANTRLGRHVFGIDQGPGTVVKITPNGFSYLESIDLKAKRGNVGDHFFTGPLMAVRLHQRLNPFWKFLHFMDWLVLDRQCLVPDFGFDAYVDFEGSRLDGPGFDQPMSYTSSGKTWAQLKAATAGVPGSSSTTIAYVAVHAGADSSDFGGLYRTIHTFDTTDGLESGNSAHEITFKVMPYEVTGASILWIGSEHGLICTEPDVDYPTNKVYSADWDNFQLSTPTSEEVLTSTIQAHSWIDMVFNADGIASYNNSGITQVGLCMLGDQANNEPSYDDGFAWVRVYLYDYNNGQYAPVLSVKYSVNLWFGDGSLQKDIVGVKINIGDDWKEVANMYINIGDVWKSVN